MSQAISYGHSATLLLIQLDVVRRAFLCTRHKMNKLQSKKEVSFVSVWKNLIDSLAKIFVKVH